MSSTPHSLGAKAKRTVRGVLGTVSPRLLNTVQVARAQARYRRAPTRGPRRLLLEATTGCNYHCLMCVDHSALLRDHLPAKMMPWEQVERLIRDAAAMGTEEVWFAGRGEPLVHPQAMQMISLAASLGLRTMITTNAGRMNEQVAEELCEAGLFELSVSLNSGSAESYGAIHGVPPTERDRVLSLMKRIASRPRPPYLFASMVVLQPNAHEITRFVRDAAEAGAKAVNLLGLRWGPMFPSLVVQDVEAMKRELAAAQALAQELGIGFMTYDLPQFSEAGPGGEPAHWRLGCFVGYQFTRIDVEGNLQGCCACSNDLGTLAGGSFAEAWQAPAYQEFRAAGRCMPETKTMPDGCNCAVCGNTMDNDYAHREMGHRPLRPQA